MAHFLLTVQIPQQLSPEQAGSSASAIIKRKNKCALHLQQRC
jgi:hypothetical protein